MTTARFAALLITCVAMAACIDGGGESLQRPPPARSEALVVTTQDGTRLTGEPLRVDVRYAEPGEPSVEISGTARDPSGDTWSFLARFQGELLRASAASAPISQEQMAPGLASVQRWREDEEAAIASGGTLELSVEGNRIVGRAGKAGVDFDAEFTGLFTLTCAVRPDLMPAQSAAAPAPVPTDGAGAVLVVDSAFVSEPCRNVSRSRTFARRD